MLRFLCLVILIGVSYSKPTPDDILEYARRHPNTGVTDPEYGDLFEGDIILEAGVDATEVGPSNIISQERYRWPNNILYYDIRDTSYTSTQVAQIEDGIRDLMESTKVNGKTCVQIVQRTTQSNYVYVEKGSGCSSYIGMIGGSQRLSLADGCFRHGTIMHEFLHAFGYFHEHTRADRDDYVFINFDNIQEGKEGNFRKRIEGEEIDHLGTSYDYGGVMHYGAYGFAINPTIPTIIPNDPDAEIGQRTHLSELDIERVQIAYKCLDAKDSKYFKHLAV